MKPPYNPDNLKHSSNGILAFTDIWQDRAFKINKLQYSLYTRRGLDSWSDKEGTTLVEIDLCNCTKMELSVFFRKCADLVVKYRGHNETRHTQFSAVLDNGDQTPIKWFWINTDPQKPIIGHDIAFDTTRLCKFKNDVPIPIHLGGFFRKRWERCKYAKEKQTRQAYKTLSNLVL